jgi:hypothetical protein
LRRADTPSLSQIRSKYKRNPLTSYRQSICLPTVAAAHHGGASNPHQRSRMGQEQPRAPHPGYRAGDAWPPGRLHLEVSRTEAPPRTARLVRPQSRCASSERCQI